MQTDFECYDLDIDSLTTEAVTDGIIKNVLLVGRSSKNGYSYAPSAYGDGSQFADVPVFLSHNDRRKAPLDRPVQSVAGVVRRPRVTAEGVRADVEIAETEPGRTLLALAKTNLRKGLMGFSLVGRYSMNGAKNIVEKIVDVVSVDLVLSPATTQSVFESTTNNAEEEAMREELEALKATIEALTAEIKALKGKPSSESHTQGYQGATERRTLPAYGWDVKRALEGDIFEKESFPRSYVR